MPAASPHRSQRSGRLSRWRPRWTRRRVATVVAVLAVIAGVTVWAAWPSGRGYATSNQMITVLTGPDQQTPVTLDTTYYRPHGSSASHPVPAVLLAHGFGGTKQSVATQAKDLANSGYAVLAWTAQGFGRSTGQIHLDSPDWEVRDAQRLIDWLAARPEVRRDAPGDPRVGVVGGSYGGGLALLLAAYDHRVDAIVPQVAWNDLADAFLPNATGAGPDTGVFKKAWAGLFFGSGAGLAASAALGGGTTAGGAAGLPAERPDPQCGRFAVDVCAAYLSIASSGRATAQQLALLRASSPASVIDKILAPTLLIQGEADSLFPLAQADANARGIAAHGTAVQVAWYTGGHDGGAGPKSDQDRLRLLTGQWLDHYLRGVGPTPDGRFTYSRIAGVAAGDAGLVALAFSVDGYPGLSGQHSSDVSVAGPDQPVANPPNGTPGALSTLPGLDTGGLSSLVSGVASDVPGQHADFISAPLPAKLDVVGSPRVQLRVASPTGSAVLFVKLYDLDSNGLSTLPDGLVAPITLTGLPASIDAAAPVTVALPGIVHEFQAGHRLRLTVATSDQGYATPTAPTVYLVGLGAAAVSLPSVSATPIASPAALWVWILVALIAVLAVGLVIVVWYGRWRYRRRAYVAAAAAGLASGAGPAASGGGAGPAASGDGAGPAASGGGATPLVVRGLRKRYDDGFVAVSRVDFTVERGQVVGLLGPNGAGKTTALRVLLGLTKPTEGEVLIFGHPLAAGAPVLSRLGALVEGPGFLPHLSGMANLTTYWRCTGRPLADARLDEVLDIAGLGDAIHRKVKAYSHGMKQRLAIAQAMLGLPDLLVLDEPTDGLDPPQIAEMRRVLRRYADAQAGRAVLVSSHLLAEVEQTCSHVVVLHKGEVVAAGTVDDVVGESPSVQFDVTDLGAARAVLAGLPGVSAVAAESAATLVVDLDGTPRAEAVAALVRAGVGVDRVMPRRRLEDAFLALVGGDTVGSGHR